MHSKVAIFAKLRMNLQSPPLTLHGEFDQSNYSFPNGFLVSFSMVPTVFTLCLRITTNRWQIRNFHEIVGQKNCHFSCVVRKRLRKTQWDCFQSIPRDFLPLETWWKVGFSCEAIFLNFLSCEKWRNFTFFLKTLARTQWPFSEIDTTCLMQFFMLFWMVQAAFLFHAK